MHRPCGTGPVLASGRVRRSCDGGGRGSCCGRDEVERVAARQQVNGDGRGTLAGGGRWTRPLAGIGPVMRAATRGGPCGLAGSGCGCGRWAVGRPVRNRRDRRCRASPRTRGIPPCRVEAKPVVAGGADPGPVNGGGLLARGLPPSGTQESCGRGPLYCQRQKDRGPDKPSAVPRRAFFEGATVRELRREGRGGGGVGPCLLGALAAGGRPAGLGGRGLRGGRALVGARGGGRGE